MRSNRGGSSTPRAAAPKVSGCRWETMTVTSGQRKLMTAQQRRQRELLWNSFASVSLLTGLNLLHSSLSTPANDALSAGCFDVLTLLWCTIAHWFALMSLPLHFRVQLVPKDLTDGQLAKTYSVVNILLSFVMMCQHSHISWWQHQLDCHHHTRNRLLRKEMCSVQC